jgi:hypothetical protein
MPQLNGLARRPIAEVVNFLLIQGYVPRRRTLQLYRGGQSMPDNSHSSRDSAMQFRNSTTIQSDRFERKRHTK